MKIRKDWPWPRKLNISQFPVFESDMYSDHIRANGEQALIKGKVKGQSNIRMTEHTMKVDMEIKVCGYLSWEWGRGVNAAGLSTLAPDLTDLSCEL